MQMNFVYCRDDISLIENYDKALADNFKGWLIHHKLETQDKWGRQRDEEIPSNVLRFLGLYYFRPANELIWLSNSEHSYLHGIRRSHSEEQNAKISATLKGKRKSEETKRKMSAAQKGKPSCMKGKHHSDETKRKMSEAQKGKKLSEEHKAKISTNHKGMKGKHHTEETKAKISAILTGRHWKLVDGHHIYDYKTNKLEGK